MANKIFDCSFIIGRFQSGVPHIGHEHIMKTARDLSERLLIFVGSANATPSLRNPFSITTRIKMVERLYDDPRVIVAPIDDLTSEGDETYAWGEYLLKNIDKYIYKEPDCMFYGFSEEEGNRATRWFDAKKIESMNFTMIPRSKHPISGTIMRELMIKDERKEWMKWVNPIYHKYYDSLRQELMMIPECKELEQLYLIEKANKYIGKQ